jgi:hypothetical protein
MAIKVATVEKPKLGFHFERRNEPLLPRAEFVSRVARALMVGGAVVLFSLAIGMAGYRYLENMGWLDAYLNASMILSGMGPLAQPKTDIGKFFAGTYALYSGFVILLAAGIVFAPIFHRFLHRFHLDKAAARDGK